VNENLQLPSIVHKYPGIKQLYACINTKLVLRLPIKRERNKNISGAGLTQTV